MTKILSVIFTNDGSEEMGQQIIENLDFFNGAESRYIEELEVSEFVKNKNANKIASVDDKDVYISDITYNMGTANPLHLEAYAFYMVRNMTKEELADDEYKRYKEGINAKL